VFPRIGLQSFNHATSWFVSLHLLSNTYSLGLKVALETPLHLFSMKKSVFQASTIPKGQLDAYASKLAATAGWE